ncbi:tetratricopeptide repeat protein [Streptomyces sp. PTM05]|uniref:Tetratricopeptide repeat protein n=1 Tax=Streptantibioticus parmotrematis TaxID=2873249 RepID=A0ABS7QWB5_9ACTN|nr:tetratricopeptide repeat protein [Streptantibioticus parmotrematis]MBY8886064.1 tetratricopeptide repeat protein [Streptantibioticus parmotrematis]
MSTTTPSAGEFGRFLRDLRTRARLSQEQLAQTAGVSVRALTDMERGRTRGPQRRTVQALAQALELNSADSEYLERVADTGRPRPRPAVDPASPSILPLPRDISDFTARGPALARTLALARSVDAAHPPVVVVSGQPGLGKTSFAVHAAHALAPHFTDGQFAVDLRGMDTQPADPQDTLARLLRAVGVADSAIPRDLQDRSGLFRSIAATRRLLLLLDNAVDEDQVRPLLPSSGTSLTIVTSRHALAGLEAVHRIELDLLRREESVELMTRIIGAERVAEEAQAVRDLTDLCGHLPLAVRIAGQRLAVRPQERVGKLVTELAREERRLDTLQAGSLQVRAAFALSYRQLTPISRTVLRRAALAAGPDFSPETAALLAGTTLREAELCTRELADRGLIQPDPSSERYRFHDLLKLYATEQLSYDDTTARDAAQDRTARWMLARARAAALHFDAEHHGAPGGDPDPATAPVGLQRARAWLETERVQWLWALRHYLVRGHHQQVIDTAEAMHWYSDHTQHWAEHWVEAFQCAVDASRALGSRRHEAVHLNYLSWAYDVCVYDHQTALDVAGAALDAARECDDSLQMGWALNYGACALQNLGDVDQAITWLEGSAACLRGDRSPQSRLGELSTLNTLGCMLRDVGRADEALSIHHRSEAICHEGIPGQSPGLMTSYRATVLRHLGNDLAALDRWTEAEPRLRQALTVFESANVPAWSEPVRLELGIALRRLGRLDEARAALRAARRTLTELNNPRREEAEAELRAIDGAFVADQASP